MRVTAIAVGAHHVASARCETLEVDLAGRQTGIVLTAAIRGEPDRVQAAGEEGAVLVADAEEELLVPPAAPPGGGHVVDGRGLGLVGWSTVPVPDLAGEGAAPAQAGGRHAREAVRGPRQDAPALVPVHQLQHAGLDRPREHIHVRRPAGGPVEEGGLLAGCDSLRLRRPQQNCGHARRPHGAHDAAPGHQWQPQPRAAEDRGWCLQGLRAAVARAIIVLGLAVRHPCSRRANCRNQVNPPARSEL
mmetsp:Transcript_42615/g.127366  ORF Transcript_42615/g.127366 Transcript_42615/m.127366 type:complete len:246 (-) Transcript_42615:26-763(-)